jgi:hypothetical protein
MRFYRLINEYIHQLKEVINEKANLDMYFCWSQCAPCPKQSQFEQHPILSGEDQEGKDGLVYPQK